MESITYKANSTGRCFRGKWAMLYHKFVQEFGIHDTEAYILINGALVMPDVDFQLKMIIQEKATDTYQVAVKNELKKFLEKNFAYLF
jgi:hypothetical protein